MCIFLVKITSEQKSDYKDETVFHFCFTLHLGGVLHSCLDLAAIEDTALSSICLPSNKSAYVG